MNLLDRLGDHNILVNCDLCASNGVEGGARAFLAVGDQVEIVLCANRLRPSDVPEALIHEAVHAYDFLSKNYDLKSPEGLAHSEVRAAREAECAREWKLFQRSCTRRAATRAVRNLFPALDCQAQVEKVLDAALADQKPWQS